MVFLQVDQKTKSGLKNNFQKKPKQKLQFLTLSKVVMYWTFNSLASRPVFICVFQHSHFLSFSFKGCLYLPHICLGPPSQIVSSVSPNKPLSSTSEAGRVPCMFTPPPPDTPPRVAYYARTNRLQKPHPHTVTQTHRHKNTQIHRHRQNQQ